MLNPKCSCGKSATHNEGGVKLVCDDCSQAVEQETIYSTLRFADKDGATTDSITAAITFAIEDNLVGFKRSLREAGMSLKMRQEWELTEAEDDAVGYAQDSLRLARVLLALRS